MKKIIFTAVCTLLAFSTAQARELTSVGITVGSLGNPYFVAMVDGAKAELGRLADRVAREDVLLVPLGRVRRDRVRSELARHLLNLELVLVKLELMHGGGL